MNRNLPSNDASEFFSEIGEILDRARQQAAQTVNSAMIDAYWSTGKRIVEEEQKGATQATYGTGLLKELSKSLTQEFEALQFGRGFSFVARQMRINTETSHFYIDLVFNTYLLKCFVILDLKTEKLKHQDIGQMDTYVPCSTT